MSYQCLQHHPVEVMRLFACENCIIYKPFQTHARQLSSTRRKPVLNSNVLISLHAAFKPQNVQLYSLRTCYKSRRFDLFTGCFTRYNYFGLYHNNERFILTYLCNCFRAVTYMTVCFSTMHDECENFQSFFFLFCAKKILKSTVHLCERYNLY